MTEGAAFSYGFSDEAWDDFMRLLETFEERETDLGHKVGDRFLDRFERYVLPSPLTLVRHPKHEKLHVFRERRFLLRAFYYLREDVVIIIAVEHMREKPDKWRGRLRQVES